MSFSFSSIALWSITKKKPLIVHPHHSQPESEVVTRVEEEEHWVTAVAAYPSTDLVASGIWLM